MVETVIREGNYDKFRGRLARGGGAGGRPRTRRERGPMGLLKPQGLHSMFCLI